MNDELRQHFDTVTTEIYDRCWQNAPNYGVDLERFRASLEKTTGKHLVAGASEPLTISELAEFLSQIQADDLYLAIACSEGNERAWWEFDQNQRSYMQRVARHLAKTEMDADEVVDWVYGELYGTRIVDGQRVSKFSTYGGRGSLRGWLRTVIWHAIVDMHRASHDEVSLDEMTETIGEGAAHSNFAKPPSDGENDMIDRLTTERYRKATVSALSNSFAGLDPHERLLMSYYHVDGLKLREIARLAESESSPLKGWFQRRSQARDNDPATRVHESTVMRWLEKSYAKVLRSFRDELTGIHGLKDEEIETCMNLATTDLAGGDIYRDLAAK